MDLLFLFSYASFMYFWIRKLGLWPRCCA
ncbi:hypothetical protein Goklo_012601 [Gossypium klotzschianum]|uniref:Uncharacterized protein n=1 Tax=Gossypium klotzschianum TaxID=34286 RepID=A0A7J8VD78_9ROSI|nr:hypothetical protein [Gossypium klotzschianum]